MSHQPTSPPAILANLREQARELTKTLWAAKAPQELMDTFVEIEALKSTLDGMTLAVIGELTFSDAVRSRGWASTQDFVTHVQGGHKGSGPAVVRLATAVAEPVLSPVGRALSDGWLSLTQALVIDRAVDTLPSAPGLRTRAVRVLLEEAARLDATELKRLSQRLHTLVDPDGDDRRDERALDRLERAAHLGRHLSITDDQAGGAWIRGRCSAEDAALVKATLMPLAAPRPSSETECAPSVCSRPGCRHDGRDPRDHGVRMLDALVESCRLVQGTDQLPEAHGAVPRLTLTMDLEHLRALSGLATTETGERLSASAVRRLCCDADLVPAVLGAASEVLDVGRHRRLANATIWKALVARDRHCRFPGCTRPPLMCHAHHVHHWVDGGVTSADNMVLLCGHHHRLVHAGPWRLHADDHGHVTFQPPPGARAGRPPPDP